MSPCRSYQPVCHSEPFGPAQDKPMAKNLCRGREAFGLKKTFPYKSRFYSWFVQPSTSLD